MADILCTLVTFWMQTAHVTVPISLHMLLTKACVRFIWHCGDINLESCMLHGLAFSRDPDFGPPNLNSLFHNLAVG